LLVVILVALPVLAMSSISLITRTSSLTLEVRADRFLGASDALVEVAGVEVIDPPDLRYFESGGWGYAGGEMVERDQTTVNVLALLPAGTRLLPGPVEGSASAGGEDRSTFVNALGGALDGPLGSYRHRIVDGTAPQTDGEVAISTSLAERIDVRLGDALALTGDAGLAGPGVTPSSSMPTVVGLAEDVSCLPCDTVYTTRAVAEGLLPADSLRYYTARTFVDLPAGTDTVQLWRDLAASGVALIPRDGILHADRYPVAVDQFSSGSSVEAIAAFGLVVGFGLLEVVLLAGTAFAVGARRQVRELGLVAANGGDRRDVRRIVLAEGVVIGLVGGVAGVMLGFLPLLIGWSWWERSAGHLFGSVVIRPWELLGIASFGLLAGVLAAVIPAHTASKVPVMTALADRFVVPTKPLRRPLVGLALVVLGGVVAFGSAVRARTLQRAYDELVTAMDLGPNTLPGDISPPDIRLYVLAAVAGLGLMSIGLLVGSPALVAGLARLARFLPLVPRLAMRDSGRHRHRTAPAICAVAIAVSGSVALGIVITADDAQNRRTYTGFLPLGYTSVWGVDDSSASDAQRAQRADALTRVVDVLGAEGRVDLATAFTEGDAAVAPAETKLAPGDTWGEPVIVAAPCVPSQCGGEIAGDLAVGNADLVAFLSGQPIDASVTETLAAGGAVVLRENAIASDGEIRLSTYTALEQDADLSADGGGGLVFRATLPAVQVAATQLWAVPAAVISEQTATDLGLVGQRSTVILGNDTVPTQAQVDEASSILEGALMGLNVERGYQSDLNLALLVIGGASALVTVASVAIAVGLAAAEGRADLATLAAVGADPRRRRVLAMWQAAVVGVMGCLLGVAFGAYVAAVALEGFGLAPWLVPWPLLGAIGLAVPLLAVLVAGLFTRSRLPLVRRAAA